MNIKKENSSDIKATHAELPFATLFDCIPNSVLICDENMDVVFMNRHLETFYNSFSASYKKPFLEKIINAVQTPATRTSRRKSSHSDQKNVLQPSPNLIRIQHSKEEYVHISVFHSYTSEGEKNYNVISLINQTESVKKEEHLRRLSQIDSLTGVLNRYAISQKIGAELKRFERQTSSPSCILYLDIDHFKRINDTYGHFIGDQVLKEFSQLISKRLRAFDSFGRLGGEEFCVLLLNASLESALKVADNLLTLIRQTPVIGVVNGKKQEIFYSCSIGVALISNSKSIDGWLQRADTALYAAKRAGRDKVCAYQERDDTSLDGAISAQPSSVRKNER